MSLKHRFSCEDSENIDPATLTLSTKRKRVHEDDDLAKDVVKSIKTSGGLLTSVESSLAPTRGPSTPLTARPFTPKTTSSIKPAGRSPQSKSCKAFGRRSTIGKSRAVPGGRSNVLRPFSIATALAKDKPTAPTASKKNAGWFFDIYVDSEQDELTNLVQHSTCILDISDDEDRAKVDTRGKENIPPASLGIQLQGPSQEIAATTKTVLNEDPRIPLRELRASDYYPKDCNAFSYTVVEDDEHEKKDAGEGKLALIVSPTKPLPTPELPDFASIASILEASAPLEVTGVDEQTDSPSSKTKEEIEIWESDSATEDAARF